MTARAAPTRPDWLELLRGAVRRLGSIQAVADQVGFSRTLLSLVLAGKYDKSTIALERAVMTKLDLVACPVLGEIAGDTCRAHQAAKFSSTNPQRVALFRACRAHCPYSSLETAS